jgi:hypothetical protein
LPSTSHAEEVATLPSTSHAEGPATFSSTSHAEEAATLPSTSHAEGAATLPSTSHAEGAATLPSTSHAEGAATSLLLRVRADEIVSNPSVRVIPFNQNKTFEELLLDQVNQKPQIKTGRKWICGGSEIITSGELSEIMKETVSKKCEIQEQTRKKKITNTKENN